MFISCRMMLLWWRLCPLCVKWNRIPRCWHRYFWFFCPIMPRVFCCPKLTTCLSEAVPHRQLCLYKAGDTTQKGSGLIQLISLRYGLSQLLAGRVANRRPVWQQTPPGSYHQLKSPDSWWRARAWRLPLTTGGHPAAFFHLHYGQCGTVYSTPIRDQV